MNERPTTHAQRLGSWNNRNESRVWEHEILMIQVCGESYQCFIWEHTFPMGIHISHGNMYNGHPDDDICYHMRDGLSAGFSADGIHLVRT